MFPPAPRYYTQYEGKRCALPLLADDYGLYYNKKLFKAAGITRPPQTISELAADAKKLTVRDTSGKIKVAGLRPGRRLLREHARPLDPAYGAKWLDAKGNSIARQRPGLGEVGEVAEEPRSTGTATTSSSASRRGSATSSTPSKAFEIGKLAMNFDGEWRVAFIHNEHPDLDYGTAPMPVDDAHPELYGSGYINGTIIGIPTRREAPGPGVGARQVPDDERPRAGRALERPAQRADDAELAARRRRSIPDAHFATFLKIFANPKSSDVADPRVGPGVHEPPCRTSSRSGRPARSRTCGGALKKLDEAARRPGRPGQGRRRGAVSRRHVGRAGARAPARRAAHGRRGVGPTGGAAGSCCC